MHPWLRPPKLCTLLLFSLCPIVLITYLCNLPKPLRSGWQPLSPTAPAVLYWDADSSGWWSVDNVCPIPCKKLTNRSQVSEADVILFNAASYLLKYRPFPKKQRKEQLLVAVRYEPYYLNYRLYADNLTKNHQLDGVIGYTKDDDIWMPYLPCSWLTSRVVRKDIFSHCTERGYRYPWMRTTRSADIIAVVSNCNVTVGYERLNYLTLLMELIPIDSYGKCLRNKGVHTSLRGLKEGASLQQSLEVKRALLRLYPFALVFENSIAKDYVSEKVYDALEADTLPIYMGAPNVDEFLPCEQCIVKVHDFSSPEALVSYLRYLLATPQKYEAYFAWKRNRQLRPAFMSFLNRCEVTGNFDPVCMACSRIREKDSVDRTSTTRW